MEVCLPVPEAVCRLRWRYSIIIHMRMTVTAHILITAAIRYSGELFFASIVIAILLVIALLASLYTIFVGNAVSVGGCRYFMENREHQTSASKVFYGFQNGRYGNVVKTMFFRDLFILLWTLLLIVPGIIKSYSYRLVPYILSENPHMDRKRALELSQQMMDGHKMEAFVLELSFFGWFLLSTLTCGLVGIFYVNPYWMRHLQNFMWQSEQRASEKDWWQKENFQVIVLRQFKRRILQMQDSF